MDIWFTTLHLWRIRIPQTMLWLMLRMTSAMTMCVTSLARSAPSDTSRYRGLDDSIDDEDIRAFFSQFGTVTGVAQHRWAASS